MVHGEDLIEGEKTEGRSREPGAFERESIKPAHVARGDTWDCGEGRRKSQYDPAMDAENEALTRLVHDGETSRVTQIAGCSTSFVLHYFRGLRR